MLVKITFGVPVTVRFDPKAVFQIVAVAVLVTVIVPVAPNAMVRVAFAEVNVRQVRLKLLTLIVPELWVMVLAHVKASPKETLIPTPATVTPPLKVFPADVNVPVPDIVKVPE